MPIRFYGGVEGSGKTCMMTRDLYNHVNLAGGRVLAFPGYELRNAKGKVLSETFMPQDMINFGETLKKKRAVIVFDEVTNWINNHGWQNRFCDLVAAVAAQRRKLVVGVFMTGPIFERLPPIVQELVHEIVYCEDIHRTKREIPRGEQCIYYKRDLRGLFSYPGRPFTIKRIFKTKPWWPYYDTEQIVEFTNQFMRLKFKNKEIWVSPDGQIINSPDRNIETNSIKEKLLYGIASLKRAGKSVMPTYHFWDFMKSEFGLVGETSMLGKLLPKETIRKMNHNKYLYDFTYIEV